MRLGTGAKPAAGTDLLYARVVVDSSARALSRTFTYRVPPELNVAPGSIVEVPFGNRRLAGYVVDLQPRPEDGLDPERIRDLKRLLEPEPLWVEGTLELAAWMRGFYSCTWQDALQAAIPGPVLRRLRDLPKRKGKSRSTPIEGLGLEAHPAPRLLPGQEQVLAAIREARAEGKGVLLFGVTGSGKTEVYLRAVGEVLEQGRQAIVMVPEVALTPQAVDRYRARLGEKVGILHSGLSDAQRRHEWWRLRRGEVPVALGTRSAVFAPLPDPALFILDEEHDGSYKQSQTPRYHARQVAAFRAARSGGTLLLGSATPSLESFYLASRGFYRLAELSERASGGALPGVQRVDMRRYSRSPRAPLVSPPLAERIRDRVSRGEQVVLLLNRRGFSNYLQCLDCGEVPRCTTCSISLTYHRSVSSLRCHYCFHQEPVPDSCRNCGGVRVSYRGAGTERLEQELASIAPGAAVARLDRDSTARPGAHARILRGFGGGEVQILLGTQMVAKGLDFPNVTLVGVLSADAGMNLPDFRAAERTFQLITQVAGRAGRGTLPGEVVVQAMDPEDPGLIAACAQDYRAFFERELEVRRQSEYPPFCRLVRILVTGPEEERVAATARRIAEDLQRARKGRVVGPAPCPVARIRGNYRWHMLLKGNKVQELIDAVRKYPDAFPEAPEISVVIDPDPQSLM
ncbi:MAG: primosomal protein N' [Armatimonadetes bacterium]|nr:primosomal protein N' [Armatimonadota bacterium]